jgi:hypothetical protein
MEHVSELAALKFTDTPGCTDPLLAALAQLVNDAISDDARRRLLGFARQLAIRPRGGTASAPAIVLAAPMPILERQPQRRDLRRHQARARRRFSRVETTIDGTSEADSETSYTGEDPLDTHSWPRSAPRAESSPTQPETSS